MTTDNEGGAPVGDPDDDVLVDLQPGYAMLPEWVMDRFSDRAIHVYARLKRLAATGRAPYPSRQWLAERMRCSTDSVDRAVKELRDGGALIVKRRGMRLTNQYLLVWDAPDSAPVRTHDSAPVPTQDSAPVRTEVQEGEVQNPPVPSGQSPQDPEWLPKRVDRKPVTPDERDLCDDILASFNRQAGTSFTGAADHRRAIVGRIREHPELTLKQHDYLIHVALDEPWWMGSPSPSVVYGNSGVFANALQSAKDRAAGVRRKTRNGGGRVSHAEQVTAGTDRLRAIAAQRRQEEAA